MQTKREYLVISGALATLLLTIVMWFSTPAQVFADCFDDGENVGLFCRDQFPSMCPQCVASRCETMFGGMTACFNECVQAGDAICGAR
jgi:hypothetical protein